MHPSRKPRNRTGRGKSRAGNRRADGFVTAGKRRRSGRPGDGRQRHPRPSGSGLGFVGDRRPAGGVPDPAASPRFSEPEPHADVEQGGVDAGFARRAEPQPVLGRVGPESALGGPEIPITGLERDGQVKLVADADLPSKHRIGRGLSRMVDRGAWWLKSRASVLGRGRWRNPPGRSEGPILRAILICVVGVLPRAPLSTIRDKPLSELLSLDTRATPAPPAMKG